MKKYEEIWKSMRRDWGDIKPVTKVIPNKKKNQKIKRKKQLKDMTD